MLTWLDWYVRKGADDARMLFRVRGWSLPRTPESKEDMLAAFAVFVAASGVRPEHEILFLYRLLMPFLRGFLPPDYPELRVKYPDTGPARGFVLTRERIELLADADPPATDPWRERVFADPPRGEGLGGVYVDVPHGAVRLGTNDQVRALFAMPVTQKSEDGHGFVRSETVLVGIIVTGRGSELPVGFVFVFVGSDGRLVVPTTTDGRLIGHLEPPADAGFSSEKEVYDLVLVRSVNLLRLVLAYHEYGPAEARSVVRATPPREIARRGHRPRKGESIFSMVRLSASGDRLGRPLCAASAGLSRCAQAGQRMRAVFPSFDRREGHRSRALYGLPDSRGGSAAWPVRVHPGDDR